MLAQCLEWYEADVKESIDSLYSEYSADLTLSRISKAKGQIEGLITASQFESVFARYEMVGGDDV